MDAQKISHLRRRIALMQTMLKTAIEECSAKRPHKNWLEISLFCKTMSDLRIQHLNEFIDGYKVQLAQLEMASATSSETRLHREASKRIIAAVQA